MSGDKDGLLYWLQVLLSTIAALLSHLDWGCLTVGHWGLQSPQSASWSSRWHPVSNWIKPSGHLVILFSNIHLLPLFFHLFTHVHLLTDGSVKGQYITERNSSRWYPNAISHLCRWYPNAISHLCRWYPNAISYLCRWYPNAISHLYRWYQNAISHLYRWYQKAISHLCRWYQNAISYLYRWYQNAISHLCRWYQNAISYLYRWYQNAISHLCRWYQKTISHLCRWYQKAISYSFWKMLLKSGYVNVHSKNFRSIPNLLY